MTRNDPSAAGYAGDLQASEAWDLLRARSDAQLVDVRTAPEWSFVGLPDLSSLGREVHRIEWQHYPEMTVNPDFTAAVCQAMAKIGVTPEAPLIFLCRSGARSRSAAMAMTQAGCAKAFNLAGGFEGDLDPERHRGRTNGWKASGLPWRQT